MTEETTSKAMVETEEASSATASPQRFRHYLNLEQKLALIDAIDQTRRGAASREKTCRVASKFGVSTSTAYHIYQNRVGLRRLQAQLKEKRAGTGEDAQGTVERQPQQKRQRTHLPLKQKLEIIELIERRKTGAIRMSFQDIGERFGISASCAWYTYMRRKSLLQQAELEAGKPGASNEIPELDDLEELDGYPDVQDEQSTLRCSSEPPSLSELSPSSPSLDKPVSKVQKPLSPRAAAFSIEALLASLSDETYSSRVPFEETKVLRSASLPVQLDAFPLYSFTGQPPLQPQ